MAQIKAAFFDIDGTLLPFHAKALPESTVQALAALRENGVKTFIATGRPPVHLPYLHALDGIPFDGYVTMNGQYCYLADGELLYTKYIPAASLQTLLPYIEKEQLSVGFVGKDFCRFNLINDLSRDFAKKLELGAGDVAALIQHEDIYQLSAFLPPEKEAEFLRRCPGCLAVRWEDDFCDILPAGGGKPNGLAHTLAHLGLTREQSIAFGDGGNDVTMLEYAGIGVAMGKRLRCRQGRRGLCHRRHYRRRPCKGTGAFWADLNKLSFPRGRRPAGAAYMRPAAVRQMTSCGKAAGRACPAPTAIYKASP